MAFPKLNYGSIRAVSSTSFVWHVPQIIDMIGEEEKYVLLSPHFLFQRHTWYIKVWRKQTKSGPVSRLYVNKTVQSTDCTQTYRLRVIDMNGEHYRPFPVLRNTFTSGTQLGTPQNQPESDLLKDAGRRAPGGDVSVHLEFYLGGERLPGVAIIPDISTPSTSPNRVHHEERSVLSDSNDIENLGHNLKALLLCGRKSDVTLVVQGKELKAHQNILVARSSVFSAMLNQEWLEQASGAVHITDCDAEVFQDFLLYLYSGKVETLDVRNVVELFTVADKYDVKSLVKHCVDFMIRNLTVDYFCDFVTLALRHCELKFMESANKFLAENVKQIIATEKWKVFTVHNPSVASELLVKALLP